MSIRELMFEELALVAGGNEGNGGDQAGTGSMGGGDGQGNGGVGSSDGGYGFSDTGFSYSAVSLNDLKGDLRGTLVALGIEYGLGWAYNVLSSPNFGTGAGIQGGNEASNALGPAFAGGYDSTFSNSYSGSN